MVLSNIYNLFEASDVIQSFFLHFFFCNIFISCIFWCIDQRNLEKVEKVTTWIHETYPPSLHTTLARYFGYQILF